MLARLQQALTLGALLLAGVWAGVFVRAGHPVWAGLGALFVVGSYALVLGLEFALLKRAHGNDPAPRATPGELLRAWWGEVRSAPKVFCWRQPFFSQRYPDSADRAASDNPSLATPNAAASQRGVVLIHGFVCNRGIWNRWLQRLQRDGVPVVAVNLEPVFGSIDDYAPHIEAAVRRIERLTGQAPVLVAHSMGGLALRGWWAQAGNEHRVHHAITIATPHHGTWLARYAITLNGRQMRLNSHWLQALAAREPANRSAHFTCYYGHCDNIVFPPSSATLAGADNRHLIGVAHVHMADHAAPWAELQRWIAPGRAT